MSKTVLLARAQVAAAALGHPHIAAESLTKIPDIQHMPATVATLVSLKEGVGDIEGVTTMLDAAIKWWSNAMTKDNKLHLIMKDAASFMLRHGQAEDAARQFKEFVKSNRSVEALVGLVTTVAHVDVGKAETYERQLKALLGVKGIDVDGLEKTPGAKHVEVASYAVGTEAQEEGKSKVKGKKMRKRKPRYPKGFDPAKPRPPPDPERWLPKWERSSYRPKRKDKRTTQLRGSQGAVVREKLEAGVAASSTNNSSSKSNQATTSKGASQNTQQSKSKSSRKKFRN